MIILGLDISTSNIGFCVIKKASQECDTLLLASGLPLSKTKGLYAKAKLFKQELANIVKKVEDSSSGKIDVIVIEQSLQAFRRNMSSAATISKLNRFNGIISYIARSDLQVPVHMVNVISARKQVGLKLNRNSEKNTKEQVFDWCKLNKTMSNFIWPTKILKSGPCKGQVRHENFCFDIADAFVVAHWGSQYLKIDELDPHNV